LSVWHLANWRPPRHPANGPKPLPGAGPVWFSRMTAEGSLLKEQSEDDDGWMRRRTDSVPPGTLGAGIGYMPVQLFRVECALPHLPACASDRPRGHTLARPHAGEPTGPAILRREQGRLPPRGPAYGTLKNGSVFRVVEYAPGVLPRDHRTDSIDYAVVMSGEIDMEMDDTVVHLKAGDVLVQRGTIHSWVNHGTAPCVIAFVLISSDSNTAVG
jgi:quercetin dioxygenase-like cupin family protein